jgi:hypothetical protein
MRETVGINPFRNGPSREKAARMAASRWNWERTRIPLFAEQIPAPDPDVIVAAYSRKADDWERMEQRFIRRAHRFRRMVSRRVSTEKLAKLDAQRLKLPGDPAYGADFWRRQLVELLERLPRKRQSG